MAEVTANEIHHKNNSYGVAKLKNDVAKAGRITGKARRDIEQEMGRKVAEKTNYNGLTSNKEKSLPKKWFGINILKEKATNDKNA